MRHLLTLVLLLSIPVLAGDKQHNHKMHMSKEAKESHALISLPTLQCQNCAKTIEKALNKVDGIKNLAIDVDKKTAHVNFDPEKVKQADIEKAIAAAGYDANDTKRDEKAHSELDSCCQSSRDGQSTK